MYDKLPSFIYFTIITIAAVMLVVTKIMITLIVHVHEKGKILRDKWNARLTILSILRESWPV